MKFQGIFKEITYQSKEFREILTIKIRNFDFENGSTGSKHVFNNNSALYS
jgi:hypothetical protein